MLLVDETGPKIISKYAQIRNNGIREKFRNLSKEIKQYFYPTDLEINMIHFLEVSFSSVVACLLNLLEVHSFCMPFHSCHFSSIFLFHPTAHPFTVGGHLPETASQSLPESH